VCLFVAIDLILDGPGLPNPGAFFSGMLTLTQEGRHEAEAVSEGRLPLSCPSSDDLRQKAMLSCQLPNLAQGLRMIGRAAKVLRG
jgi:hypothetical protein